MKRYYALIALLVLCHGSFAQNFSNLRKKLVHISDSVSLDTLSIIPGSEIVKNENGKTINDSLYTLNYNKALIFFEAEKVTSKKAQIIYRVFPLNFSAQYPKKPLLYNDSAENTINNKPILYKHSPNPTNNNETNLNVTGNISRGVSVGNSQNTTVNSNLNLQLSGEISNNLMIEAYLSDKNIPVQPDGYTQQVGEFDQIYIRIYDSLRTLQMGDVEINGRNSHFLQFNRRILGGNFTNQQIKISENAIAKSQVSAAISKGNFKRSEFTGIEGVQGPYQLKGNNNENHIIILAGTETVYLDGTELKRGEDQDYIINYNTAEISFTPNNYITKNSRIIVEFEYSDKNYNRFVFYTQNEVLHKKAKYTVQYFTEGDAKNQPVNIQLTDEHKEILSNAGADPLKAVVPNFDSVGFDPNRVLYKMIDTTVNARNYDSILVFSINPDSAIYQAGFALVGENKGNYIQQISTANGRVYKWIAPVNGIAQGNYEPIQLLIAPEKKQMLVLKTSYKISKNTSATVELAYADKNNNSFSDLPETRNNGIAVKNLISHNKNLNRNTLASSLNYEYKQKSFIPVERYRNAEFNRDWNLLIPYNNDEHLIQAQIGLLKEKQKTFNYTFEHLNYTDSYLGFKNSITTNLNFGKFNLKLKSGLLNSKSNLDNTQFYRHKITLSRSVWKLKLGLHNDFEDNQQKLISSDSLRTTSKKYNLSEAFIMNSDSVKHQFRLSYKNRMDYLPQNNRFSETTESDDIAFLFAPKTGNNHEIKTTITWRNLKVKDQIPNNTKSNEQNLLSRIDHKYNSHKRAISLYTFYEIGTGVENKKEFSYIEVQAGQGIYIWNDYNNNGIAELDEFEISPFPEEANYLRIYTPTNDYIKVYTLKFNETVKLNPGRVWRNEKGIKKFISRFENTFSFRASHKHIQSDLISKINPLPGYVHDTAQMNRNISFRNTFSFNRSHPKFGADYSYNQQNFKLLQNNGFDVSDSYLHQIKIRWNLHSEFMIINYTNYKNKEYRSEYFTRKDYLIESLGNSSSMQWQPTMKFRLLLHYQITDKRNNIGTETALLQESGPEIKINATKKGLVSIKTTIIINKYTGDTNSPITYNMLEGYQPGENYRWSVNYSRNINNFLRINMNYSGRKPNNNSVVHTGQFSVSAIF